MKLNSQRIFSMVLYGLGVLIGIVFFGLAAWGDLEASLFSSAITGDENLSTMTCPIFLTPSETGQVKAVIENKLDKTINAVVRSQISLGLVTYKREDTVQVRLEPGEKQLVSWNVTSEDAVWDRVIFARIYKFANYPEKSKGGSCGILVLNLPLMKGNLIVALATILSSLGILSGLFIWQRTHQPLQDRAKEVMRGMVLLGIIVGGGILSAFLGAWFLGLLALLLALILIGSLMTNLSMP